jgi:hypothetical protein
MRLRTQAVIVSQNFRTSERFCDEVDGSFYERHHCNRVFFGVYFFDVGCLRGLVVVIKYSVVPASHIGTPFYF